MGETVFVDRGSRRVAPGVAQVCRAVVRLGQALPPENRITEDEHRRHQLTSSSVHTRKLSSLFGQKAVLMATSAASRPRATRMRPILGTLLRGSNVCHWPPRKASNHPAKSMGAYGGGTPMSLR